MPHSNRKPKMLKYTLKDFQRQYPDDATCLEWLRNYLYPDGIYCETCEAVTKHHRVKSRPSYSCDHCGHHVHPTADTIFHKSATPLTTWFYAIYLMAQTRCGISAKQIQRETGVTYKTAWRMFRQIRSMLDESESGTKLGGSQKPVEVDEMYVGPRTKRLRSIPKPKTPVVGLVQRKGSVRAFVVADVKKDTLHGLIKEHVLPSNLVFTDDFPAYDGLSRTPHNYYHRRIRHSERVYVTGDVHTQTIEGFWGLVKNGIRGVYHNVGRHYLQTYLNEYSFRYNRRFDEQPMFMSFLKQVEKRDAVVRQSIPVPEPF
ncbi:MAG: IS1595 family transposase [Terriglobales bacterium]